MSHISVSYTENLPDGAARTKPWIWHLTNISIYFLREKYLRKTHFRQRDTTFKDDTAVTQESLYCETHFIITLGQASLLVSKITTSKTTWL